MNNLNKDTQNISKEVPDILQNLNIKEDINEKKEYHKDSVDDVLEKKKLNVDKNILSEQQSDLLHSDEERKKSRKVKKALGYAGWVLCFPLMLAALAIRDKPSKQDADEWKDDPCLPWWYDVNYKYPGEDDIDSL